MPAPGLTGLHLRHQLGPDIVVQRLQDFFGRHARYRAEFPVEAAAVRHDVHSAAAFDDADVEGGPGRHEAAVGPPGDTQALDDLFDLADDPRGIDDSADRLVRTARMGFEARHRRPHCRDALVAVDNAHGSRLADQDERRLRQIAAQPLDQMRHALAPDFLVERKGEMDRYPEIGGFHGGGHGQRDGDEAFHVCRTAAEELVVPFRQHERVCRPGLADDRDHIGMARQRDPAFDAVRTVSGNCRVEVRFRLVSARSQAAFDAEDVEIVPNPVDHRHVGLRRRRIEADDGFQDRTDFSEARGQRITPSRRMGGTGPIPQISPARQSASRPKTATSPYRSGRCSCFPGRFSAPAPGRHWRWRWPRPTMR